MKNILVILILSIISTGCFNPKLYLYDSDTKLYLKKSRQFNEEYNKTHSVQQYIFSEIKYKRDSADIMRCPAWVIDNKGADCDGLAYLSTLFMPLQFDSFMIMQGDDFGHVVAVYKQDDGLYCIVTNLVLVRDQTIKGYIDVYGKGCKYVAFADINLNFKKSYLVD